MTVLTTLPHDDLLDLDPWVGQRAATFRFALVNGVTGERLGDLTPIRGASLTHDTNRIIKRQLDLKLGVADTAAINGITDRVEPFMVFPNGTEYPLGRYMFTDFTRQKFTSGKLGQVALTDEMFLVDQQITKGINGVGSGVVTVIQEVLSSLPITYTLEPAPFISAESWSVGASRGSILESLSISGDWFSPWFGNDGKLHFIRTFEPVDRICDLDFDVGNKVFRQSIVENDDLLTAPNTFVVISNSASNPDTQVVGIATVPPTDPHSLANRGFTVAQVVNLQLSDAGQAQAVAQGLANRQNIFERVSLTTAPDPRHDSYNVIRWQGANWLELAWSMALVEGGTMNHLLRKSFAA
jgi:hypothetical protein